MGQKGETKFRQRVDKFLKTIPDSWFESIQQKSINGSPDKIGVIAGLFVALELKASKKAGVTELQKYKLQKIVDAGGIGLVVYPENWTATKMFLLKLGGVKDADIDLGILE